jgi:uncharacterized protein
MALSNAPVDPHRLPALEALELAPVSPRFAPYQVLTRLLRLPFLVFLAWLVPVLTGFPVEFRPLLLSAVAVVAVLSPILAWREARRRAYGLREQDLVYQRGLLIQRTVAMPIVRIQHVETASNPLERSFNLMRITCFTAGGPGGDLVLEGLEREAAEGLRAYLLERIEVLGRQTAQRRLD